MRSDRLDPVVKLITDTGLGHVQLAGLLILIAWKRSRAYGLAALAAGVLSGIVRLGWFKFADRMRPSNWEFARPMESIYGNSSFPSGHATTSFAIAVTFFILLWPSRNRWIGFLALLWACSVAFSRVYAGVHYVTDVVAGAGLGSAAAAGIVMLFRSKGWVPVASTPNSDPSPGTSRTATP